MTSSPVGGQIAVFPNAMNAEDDLALLASTRECTRNGSPEKKEGFYQYSAAWDSKHRVTKRHGYYLRCRKCRMKDHLREKKVEIHKKG